ncbi:Siderophore iron transporter 3 [Hypsizygus marmoreus]|uniref:Siderophore iron transporter 3 n=1 Tax=Hypsizygus marmoreus TaxID=39966 RepID=A0A369JYB9_HYPMA|nr:Siderophore iron transporter 3 [Hypsizygus marmoreus]
MSAEKDSASGKSVEADHKDHTLSTKPDDVDIAHHGVKTVEATHKVYGKYSKWALFISLGLAAYIYSLDGTTTYTYLAYAASEFKDHSLISPIQVAQSIIVAVGKPVVAKIADVSSRGSAYAFVLVFYVVGYIVIASAQNIQTVAGGIILYAVGYTGLQLLTQIIIADITTLKWRGLVSALMTTPFIVNAFVGANVSANVIQGAGWRWGYGMFAILVPAALLPLIITLLWAENKARKLGILAAGRNGEVAGPKPPLYKRLIRGADQLDIPGLMLIGTSVALILLPLTLSQSAKGGWNNASMIAMLVVGCVLIPAFVLYDFKFARYPVVAKRFCLNRTVVIAAITGAFDFISFYLTFTYLYSFIVVVKPWTLVNVTYFTQTQTVALCVFGIVAGFAMRYLRRYKHVLIIGLAIRLVGVGLMIHSRGANGSDAEIVWTQLLQGIGGGFAAVTSQVAAQASVPHSDVAMVTAVVLLVTEIGGAIGSAIAGAIWTNLMPGKLALHLPDVSEEDRATLFGSIVAAIEYPRGSPIREGVIQAYDDVMKVMLIAATVLAAVPLVLAFFMPNWRLGDTQNAVENVDLKGERVQDSDPTDVERR